MRLERRSEIAAALRRRDRRPRRAPARRVRATIDSGETGPGDLFFGLRGERVDGGEFAAGGDRGRRLGRRRRSEMPRSLADRGRRARDRRAWVFAAADPLAALQALARAWRRALGARVVGVTGSVGKTSVKDIARALLPGRVHANRENLNTEIGLPLTVLEAARGHRGPGPGDGDARRRPDRRAGGDRRARSRGDHQRRPGPRRAARLGRGDRGGEGRGAGGAAGGRDGGRPGRRPGSWSRTSAQAPRLLRFGPGGDVYARREPGRRTASPRRWSRRRPGASSSTSPSPRRTT